MPAKSKKQQMAAGAALSAKRGEIKKSSLKGASKQMADRDELAGTMLVQLARQQGLPESCSRWSNRRTWMSPAFRSLILCGAR
jgi:Protein of unknwon function (DUF3008)